MDTTCDPDVVACFLGLMPEGHFTSGFIFELFSVPISDVQAVLLIGLFFDLKQAEAIPIALFHNWMSSSFEKRFAAGYEALAAIMDEWDDHEMPPSLKKLYSDTTKVQSALNQATKLMQRIDGPLNKALEQQQDLESPEGLRLEISFYSEEEEEEDDDEEVPF
ncbi:hypothetical protein DDZ13_09630 [Coraliomargarita sinensis]|uniref:Uncharacterized protein n=2 Tax=Coraliomargarita sinensis TaxID=2174842 RepID=A0A317ZF17_9BACT|nr:hypothetical protein DDZ13_09630 [Coraliomargarita sinensis]